MNLEPSIKRGVSIIIDTAKLLPSTSGIYKMLDSKGEVMYVGKAKNLPKRIISYSNSAKLPTRLQKMLYLLDRIEYLTTETEAEALLLEAYIIKDLKPRFNILLKDDKSFPYIVIEDEHPFPRIAKFRGNKTPNRSYFGPFAQAKNVNDTIVELQKLFKIRPCTNNFFATRSRPCLQHQIKRCSAPCVNKISEQEYAQSIQQAKDFLSGKNSEIQAKLVNEMENASKNLNFEKAAELRDKIKLLSQIQSRNIFTTNNILDADLIAVYKESTLAAIQVIFIRNGKSFGSKVYFPNHIEELDEKQILELFIGQLYQQTASPSSIIINHDLDSLIALEQALKKISGFKVKIITPKKKSVRQLIEFALSNAKEALAMHKQQKAKHNYNLAKIAELFNINKPINRIEVYDNSHIHGSYAVGCMIAAGSEGLIKNQYRQYHIKTNQGKGDDYQMLREVLQRRLKKLDKTNYPDVLLIDGGKGHLTTATQVLNETGINDINIICISKGPNRNSGREFFHIPNKPAFQLRSDDPVLYYLQFLRDEAHRFAIESHRKIRTKKTIISKIDEIPGVGIHRKKLLLSHFGSLASLKLASKDDIARIKGLNKKIAGNIYNCLHQK
jgi:excinuclease ABC subunit C